MRREAETRFNGLLPEEGWSQLLAAVASGRAAAPQAALALLEAKQAQQPEKRRSLLRRLLGPAAAVGGGAALGVGAALGAREVRMVAKAIVHQQNQDDYGASMHHDDGTGGDGGFAPAAPKGPWHDPHWMEPKPKAPAPASGHGFPGMPSQDYLDKHKIIREMGLEPHEEKLALELLAQQEAKRAQGHRR